MPRIHFYHTVLRLNPTSGDVEPLDNIEAIPFSVDIAGTESGSEAPYYAGRTGATVGNNLSSEGGVVQFYLEAGDYNVHMEDQEVPTRIANFVVGVNGASGSQVTTLQAIKEPISTVVTTLPSSPVDGQTVLYRPPVEITGVSTAMIDDTEVSQAATVWQLRWMGLDPAGVDDGPIGRWQFIGGNAISRNGLWVNDIGTAQPIPLNTWYVEADSAIKPPLPGFYELTVGARHVKSAGAGSITSAAVKAVRGSGSTWTTASGWDGAPAISLRFAGIQQYPISLTREIDLSDFESGELLAVAMISAGPDILSVADAYMRLRPVWLVPF